MPIVTVASLTLLALLAFNAGCGDSEATPDAADTTTTDTGDSADTLADVEVAPACCPIAPGPSCDCFALGGSVEDGCHNLCDAIPIGWTLGTDENGCPIWTGGDPGSCLDIDTDVADSSDATDTEDVPDAGDTSDTTDTDTADTDTTDTEVVTPPDDVSLRFALAGAIRVVEAYSSGAGMVVGAWVEIDLRDRPAPMTYVLAAEDGACKVWVPAEVMCTPPCAVDQTCAATADCEPQSVAASAGELTLAGLVTTFTAKDVGGGYTLSPEPPSDGLVDAGDAITVAAAGAAIPAFTAALRGVADLAIEGTGLVELADGKETTLEWTPAGDGSLVEAVLQLGWHGAPPTGIIACRAPDSAGAITITPTVIRPFPYFGGIGLFQVPSWLERVSRTVVDAPGGPIEITASSRVNLGVMHAE